MKGPNKGEFIAPLDINDGDERGDALPAQEEFWRPPVRFGTVPVEKEPLGWDGRRGFRKLFPVVPLPTQVVERVTFGHQNLEPNRLFWGDNLHVMRQIPSETIDLIYIDPPFFSGRQYNVIFGDQNELRSFSDIWESGMPGYLIWLNARLYEMKRLLKKTGSIFVHCDWHASHYIKSEMDKIYGYTNFRNEIIWYYYNKMHDSRKGQLPNACDVILWYSKGNDYKYFEQKEQREKPVKQLVRKKKNGKMVNARDDEGNVMYRNSTDRTVDNIWRIPALQPADTLERVGYPTQKPLEITQRIIDMVTEPGDIVADFFCGGGGFLVSAQGVRAIRTSSGQSTKKEVIGDVKLARRWIGCDQSRIAVSITSDRIAKAMDDYVGTLFPVPDFTVEHWGIYEVERLSKMPTEHFQAFIIRAFGAVPDNEIPHIHGYKGAIPVWVGDSSQRSQVSATEVLDFANGIKKTIRYKQDNLRDGIMLAWAFRPDALNAAEQLREMEQTDLNFIRLEQIRIDSLRFREHVAALSTGNADYASFLTFVQPPRVSVGWKRLATLTYKFDVSETVILNTGAKIINVQWDFNYEGRFTSTPGYSFIQGPKKEPVYQVQFEFPKMGKQMIACKVQDDMGGEGTWIGEIEVS